MKLHFTNNWLRGEIDRSEDLEVEAGGAKFMSLLRSVRKNTDRAAAAQAAYLKRIDRIPYHPQGPEVSAVADAVRKEHRQGALGYDDGTYMECARACLNALSEAGYIVAPIPGAKASKPC